VRTPWVFGAKLIEQLGELLGRFSVGFWGVIVLDANLVTRNRHIACIDVANVLNVEGGLIFGCFSHGI
jgi:hypothetical protein